ncbi:signal peptidase II [Candidatus Berkelbacteria bacterium]|nr:signal peptidase II [Candidatus Berkelbacteria bacterium]
MQLLIGFAVILLDQFSKWLLVDQGVFNQGIGWGFLAAQPVLSLLIVGVASIGVIAWVVRMWQSWGTVERLGGMLLLSGLFSNTFDRLVRGAVVDPLTIGSWFPHFNLADCAIVVGLIVLLVQSSISTRTIG